MKTAFVLLACLSTVPAWAKPPRQVLTLDAGLPFHGGELPPGTRLITELQALPSGRLGVGPITEVELPRPQSLFGVDAVQSFTFSDGTVALSFAPIGHIDGAQFKRVSFLCDSRRECAADLRFVTSGELAGPAVLHEVPLAAGVGAFAGFSFVAIGKPSAGKPKILPLSGYLGQPSKLHGMSLAPGRFRFEQTRRGGYLLMDGTLAEPHRVLGLDLPAGAEVLSYAGLHKVTAPVELSVEELKVKQLILAEGGEREGTLSSAQVRDGVLLPEGAKVWWSSTGGLYGVRVEMGGEVERPIGSSEFLPALPRDLGAYLGEWGECWREGKGWRCTRFVDRQP